MAAINEALAKAATPEAREEAKKQREIDWEREEKRTKKELQRQIDEDEINPSDKEALKKLDRDGVLQSEQKAISIEKFKSDNLIIHVMDEIDKRHKTDNKLKGSIFLSNTTAYLNHPKQRKSTFIKGGGSEGKTNVINASIKEMFPDEDVLDLTNATNSILEDDIKDKRIIILREYNTDRENGANQHVTERIKEMCDGGISSMKKDVKTGFRTAKHSKDEQKSVITSSTNPEIDEIEISSRFIIQGMIHNPKKYKAVNDDTHEWYSSLKFRNSVEKTSFTKHGIRGLRDTGYNEVVISYAKEFKDIFDVSEGRSMRDVKRFWDLVSGVTWLNQINRERDDVEKVVYSHPVDLLIVYLFCKDYFNYSYEGTGDLRYDHYLRCMKEYIKKYPMKEGEGNTQDVPRNEIQKMMNIGSVNTIKSISKALSEKGFIKWIRNESNKVYYQRCQNPIKKVFIGVSYNELIERIGIMKGYQLEKKHTDMLNKLIKYTEDEQEEYVFPENDTLENNDTSKVKEEEVKDDISIDNLSINTLPKDKTFTPDDISKERNIDPEIVVKVLTSHQKNGLIFEETPDHYRLL